MTVVHLTNSYLPNLGGVARSVAMYAQATRWGQRAAEVVLPEGFVRATPSLVHAHGAFGVGQTALELSASARVPLLYTHHTLLEEYAHYLDAVDGLTADALVAFHTAYCNAVHHVLAPSRHVKALLVARGVEVPISVLPTALDDAWFPDDVALAAERQWVRAELGVPSDARVYVSVGRLHAEKQPLAVAEALLAADLEAHVWFIGEGPLRPRVEAMAPSPRWRFFGPLPEARVRSLLSAADAVVTASVSETQGLSLLEGQAVGAVVLNAPHPVTDELSARLDEGDATRTLEEKIARFAKHPAQVRHQAAAAARALARRHDLASMGATLSEVYGALLAKPLPPRPAPGVAYAHAYPALTRSLLEVIRTFAPPDRPRS